MASKSAFLTKRKALSDNLGKQEIYSVIDHWPLYVGTITLARTIEILDAFRSTLDVDGDIAEFGSHKGSNIMYLAKLAQIYGVNDKKTVHCFESFEGLTNFSEKDGQQASNEGRYRGSLDVLKGAIELFGYEQNIQIHKGFIEETLPPFLQKNPDIKFSFLYYDADLYEPCKVVLDLLADKLNIGGVVLFDEYGLEEWPGETKAVDEFLQTTDKFEVIKPTITRRPGLILRKIK